MYRKLRTRTGVKPGNKLSLEAQLSDTKIRVGKGTTFSPREDWLELIYYRVGLGSSEPSLVDRYVRM